MNAESLDKAESPLARTPQPPYYAVIFTSVRRAQSDDGYGEMAERMADLAARQPGYLGVDSVRGADGVGMTVSYWESLEAIRNWKAEMEHREAQRRGKSDFYSAFRVRICRVEREYGFDRP